jgi:phosphoserine phosphatase
MSKQKEIVLLNVLGEDKPGVTATLTEILAEHKVNILDIGQAVIHEDLSLGILVEVPDQSGSSPILKDILFKAHEMGLNVKFTPISEKRYQEWVDNQGKERFIITLISRKLTALQLSKVTRLICDQGLNIDVISRLSGRIPLDASDKSEAKSVVEFSLRGTPHDIETMKRDFIAISGDTGIDIAFQEDNIYRRNRRLVCFDMDSTLIQTEVIDELARRAGVYEKVSAITESAMRGDIGNYLKNKLDIDYVFANELEIKDGKLTGRHVGEIIDGEKKAELLRLIAFKEDIHLEQVIAVGDGSNDLPMLKLAGLGIAFHAKPKVKASAKHSISTIGLDAILYLLGFRDREINM